jgi:4-diphosphocytidyl-2-C-methyl-D-erythritol kinase
MERKGASSRRGKRKGGMLTVRAPAKINLTLEVLARRDDGYHGIRSVMVPLELADELSIEPSAQFSFICDWGELASERNLAVAAVRALGAVPPMRIELRKRIPVQAGLGGGSSDAAAVLRAAMDGAFGPQPHRDWLILARTLGSDVPFFLAGTAALVEGTGERITPAGAIPRWYATIVKPPASISTAAAYAELDRAGIPSRPRKTSISIEILEALQRGDFSAVESRLQNDFHDIIVLQTPPVAAAVAALHRAGARNVLLAGSGSCVFALAPQRIQAEMLRERLDLPHEYERFTSAFATTPQWRASSLDAAWMQ